MDDRAAKRDEVKMRIAGLLHWVEHHRLATYALIL